MPYLLLTSRRRWALAALSLAMLVLHGAGRAQATAARAPLTRVRFQLRRDTHCAACGFALQGQIRKLPGVSRVVLSPRERVLTVAFDEAQVPLSRVAASVEKSELGKRSALIGDLVGDGTVSEEALAHVPGVGAAEVDRKKGRLLVELAHNVSITTAELTAALAKAGVAVRFAGTAVSKKK